ncbi:MAG TPA: nicotinamide riboside transporter PnuC [Jiangellaceae bacterium]|nr:nicotinamide riboside transporter PnuC [Jiangellaceae bacterium]
MDQLSWLLDARLQVMGSEILWREIIGNGFGLASAIAGMQRKVWAWPVGIIGNALLFTVFLGGVFDTPQDKDLYGQAARQVFFLIVSAYGWWQWSRNRRLGRTGSGHGVTPRWAGRPERLRLLAVAVVGVAIGYVALRALGSWGPLADSWIFVGSMLATYGMARGYVEFWLIWIAVDLVGVPLLLIAGYYPSALLYVVYGVFCLIGFLAWRRVERVERAVAGSPAMEAVS